MNISDKIQLVKSRMVFTGKSFIYGDLMTHHDLLSEQKTKNKLPVGETLKFYPITLVSCFEAFFKETFAEYIDKDEKYLINAKKLIGKNKIETDIDSMLALHQKKFTIGDLLSFSLKYSSLENIISNFNIILGEKFINKLKNISTKDLFEDKEEEDFKEIEKQLPNYIKYIIRAFELRHIYCHEYMANVTATVDEYLLMLDSGFKFLKATERMIYDDLYKDLPLTQVEMTQFAMDNSMKKVKELEKLLNDLKLKYPMKEKKIQQDYDDWISYIKNNAILKTDLLEKGATNWPTFYYSNLTNFIDSKIEDYKKLVLSIYLK